MHKRIGRLDCEIAYYLQDFEDSNPVVIESIIHENEDITHLFSNQDKFWIEEEIHNDL